MSLLNNTVHIKNSRAEVISLKPMDKLSLDNSMFNILTILFGSFLIAVLAQMRIHLPFSPVPITGQTVGVLLVGALLGSRMGTLSVCAYILEGAIGLPVFTGFKGGIMVLLGPTAGYIYGFLPAAFIMGWVTEKGITSRFYLSLFFCIVASFLVLLLGTFYFLIFKMSFSDAKTIGLYPFILGDLFKSVAVAVILIGIDRKA